ncbi:MAG: hypothetical protein IH623_14720 [Verrucomicrobia bacterium]|nr:hypothetical protein [Verrucomicrobiota bacterium]
MTSCTNTRTSTIARLGFAIAISWVANGLAGAQPFSPLYRAEGILKQQIHGAKPHNDQFWHFSVMEDEDGRWKVEYSTTFPNPQYPFSSRVTLSYDGTNIYSLVVSSHTMNLAAGQIRMEDSGPHRNAGGVSGGPYPLDHSAAVGLLWLAFVGGRYADPGASSLQLPNLIVTDARTDPMTWVCDFEYVLEAAKSRRPLVATGTYVLNTNYVKARVADYVELDEPGTDEAVQIQRLRFRAYRELSASQLKRAEYKAEEVIEVDGVLVPKVFHCYMAGPIGIDTPNAVLPYVTFEGLVTNVAARVQTNLLPEVEGVVTVSDRRFRYKGDNEWRRLALYNLKGSTWVVNTNDVNSGATNFAQPPLRKYRTKLTRSAGLHYVVVVLFILACAVPLALVIRANLRKTHLRHDGRI